MCSFIGIPHRAAVLLLRSYQRFLRDLFNFGVQCLRCLRRSQECCWHFLFQLYWYGHSSLKTASNLQTHHKISVSKINFGKIVSPSTLNLERSRSPTTFCDTKNYSLSNNCSTPGSTGIWIYKITRVFTYKAIPTVDINHIVLPEKYSSSLQ